MRVYYYRRGSAASKMAPGAFNPDYLRGGVFQARREAIIELGSVSGIAEEIIAAIA